MTWTVTEEPRLRGYAVEWLDADTMLLSRRNQLYGARGAQPPQPVGRIPVPWWEGLASRVRLAQRLLRAMVYNAVPLADGTLFVTYGKRVGRLRSGRYAELPGLVLPCRVLRGGVAQDRDGNLYFGAYLTNRARHAMHVYRYVPGAPSVEVVHEFPAGDIRHVHGVHRDPYDDALWCLTGDFGAECRVLRTRDGFATLETVGGGDESWRCVSLLFTPQHVYYATDAEFERNRLYRLDRLTGQRDSLGELDGPTYYAHAHGDQMFFGITAELCPSQVGRQASLWRLDPAGALERLAAFEKDRWPVSLFLPGMLHFPAGPGRRDEVLIQAVGLQGADNRTFRVCPIR